MKSQHNRAKDLALDIRQIYFSRLDELDLNTRFHFTSRLYCWSTDKDALEYLQKLKPEFLPEEREQRLNVLHQIRQNLPDVSVVNALEERRPFFEKYSSLREITFVLFRLRHWLHIYGEDERDLLFNIYDESELDQIAQQLKSDNDAIKVLSTYAINFLYLYSLLFKESEPVDLGRILDIGQTYGDSKADMQLQIYLYTHCVIGESLFYHVPVTQRLSSYREMLTRMEDLIGNDFDDINLDNKFEFLVCARLCSFTSRLEERIENEALQSLHDEGFLIDAHNNNPHPNKGSYPTSEHRNVLFIMSQLQMKLEGKPAM